MYIQQDKYLSGSFMNNVRISLRGFTLVEMLVSLALLSIVMMVAIGTLLTIVDANRQAQSINSVTTNISFALDSMSRTIRTGYGYNCGSLTGGDCPGGGESFYFTTHDGKAMVYAYNASEKSIERTIDGGAVERLTAEEVRINDISFVVTGSAVGSPDNTQPTVTIMIQAAAGDDPSTDTTFNIGTTLTQRILDL